MKSKTHNEFVSDLKNIQPNLIVLNQYLNNYTHILIQDESGIQYLSKPNNLLQGFKPSIKSALDKTAVFKIQLKIIQPQLKIIGKYKNNKTRILVQDEKNITYLSLPYNLLSGQQPTINSAENKNLAFKILSEKTHGINSFDYSRSIYIAALKKIDIFCKTCNTTFMQAPARHWLGQRCTHCNKSRLKQNAKNKIEHRLLTITRDINKKHNGKINCDKLIYNGNKTKSLFGCNINNAHGYWLATPNDILSGCGCPICKSSKGELKVLEILEKLNILFERQKKFDDCINKRRLPFDFYLPEYNTCIEYDGEFHFKLIFDGGKSHVSTKENDKIKDEYCATNNIHLLRIPYTEQKNIEKIIGEFISKIHIRVR